MEKILSKDGTSIAYQRSGKGPPLLLVHGTLASHARWGRIVPVLAERFTVYALDRRGRGESGDAESYALEREFEDVAAVTDSIGEKVNVLGHSLGGLIALEAALLTENMRSLIVYEPPPAPVPDEFIERVQSSLEAENREGAITMFMREIVKMPSHELERFKSSPVFPERVAAAHTIPREFRAVEGYNAESERFKELDVPTLLLLGGDSPEFYRANTQYWHDALSDSRIVVLPGQQHIAMDMAPDLFISEVQSFLSEIN